MQMLARFKASLHPGAICPNWLALTSFDSVLRHKKQETTCGFPKERRLKEDHCSFMKLRLHCFNLGSWQEIASLIIYNNSPYRVTFPMLSYKISSQEFKVPQVPYNIYQIIPFRSNGTFNPGFKIYRLKFQSTWDLSQKKENHKMYKDPGTVSKSQQK